MEFYVADSYKNWEKVGEPYTNDKGKKVIKVKTKCGRCTNGLFITRVENGVPVPHPAYGGICLKCGGKGYEEKTVRLYTEDEYNKMKINNEKAKIKREEEREEKMQKEYAQKKAEWLEKEGFNADMVTYVATGDTYAIKDELKAAGFCFNPVLKWHRADPGDYPCITVKFDEVGVLSAWGTGSYKNEAKAFVQAKLDATLEPSHSEWVGQIGERLDGISAVVKSIRGFEGIYGYSRVFTFETSDENILIWFTSANVNADEGDLVTIKGTVKDHTEYKGTRQTQLSRCKVNKV